MEQFNAQQKASIMELTRHVHVSASAGTGKTKVLTERYIQILKQGKAYIPNILAITFTQQAVHEMRERIRKAINGALKASESPAITKQWEKHKRDFRHAQISTIHSFAARLIKQYAKVLHINPDFQILNEGVFVQALEQLFDEQSAESFSTDDQLSRALKALLKHYSYPQVRSILIECFQKGYQYASSTSLYAQDAASYVQTLTKLLSAARQESLECARCLSVVDELVEVCSASAGGPYSEYLHRIKSLALELQNTGTIAGDYTAFYKDYTLTTRSGELKKGDQEYWTQEALATHYSRVVVLLAPIRYALSESLAVVPQQEEDREESYILGQALLQVYQRLQNSISTSPERYELLHQWQTGALLLYDDLQHLCLKLLSSSEDSKFVKFSHQYTYIMVDECQDIDPVQQKIIRSFLKSDAQQANVFLVGDFKQSIYQFRGAQIQEFALLREELTQKGACSYELQINYRSQKALVEFANDVFEYLMNESIHEYDVSYIQRIIAQRPHLPDACDSAVQIVLCQEEPGKDAFAAEAQKILELLVYYTQKRKYAYGDIAVLFESMIHVQSLEDLLYRMNVPYQISKAGDFYAYQEIADCLLLLEYLDFPDPSIFVALLRSPFCAVSDSALYWLAYHKSLHDCYALKSLLASNHFDDCLNDEDSRKLRHFLDLLSFLLRRKDFVKLSELVSLALSRSLYSVVLNSLPHPSEPKLRLHDFLQIIYKLEKHSCVTIQQFLRYARSHSYEVSPPTLHPLKVQIMTVHKAKGLEFPVVILAQSHQKLRARGEQFLLNEELGLAFRSYKAQANTTSTGRLFQFLQEHELKKTIAERKRLFYVAMTRARDYFILTGKLPSDSNSQKGTSRYTSCSYLEYVLDFLCHSRLHPRHSVYNSTATFPDYALTLSCSSSSGETLLPATQDTAQTPSKVFLQTTRSNSFLTLESLPVSAFVSYHTSAQEFYYKYFWHIKEVPGLCTSPQYSLPMEYSENTNPQAAGTLLHSILEHIDLIPEALIDSLVSQHMPDSATHEHLLTLLSQFLQSPTYKAIKQSAQAYPRHQFRELQFLYRFDTLSITGAIDRIIYSQKGYTLIDYKSNSFPASPEAQSSRLEALNRHYTLQMQIYYLVARSLFAKISDVELYYLALNKSCPAFSTEELSTDTIKNTLKDILQKICSTASYTTL